MTVKHRFTVSFDDATDGTLGICLSCGEIQYGAEPDAENYECDYCGDHQVMGIEQAVLMGYADLDDEEDYE